MPNSKNQAKADQRHILTTVSDAIPDEWLCSPVGNHCIKVTTALRYPDDASINIYLSPGTGNYDYVASDRGEALKRANKIARGKRLAPPHIILTPLSLSMLYGAIIGGARDRTEISSLCTKMAQAALRIVKAAER